MHKIQIDDTTSFTVENGLCIGITDDNQIRIAVAGQPSTDEILDMCNTVTYDALNILREHVIKNNPNLDETVVMNNIYEEAVMGFSLMMDKFNPEYKEHVKFQGLTDQAIMEAQDKILLRKAEQLKGKPKQTQSDFSAQTKEKLNRKTETKLKKNEDSICKQG